MSLTNSSPEAAARAASEASFALASRTCEARNQALMAIHSALSQKREEILQANAADLAAAMQSASKGELSQSLVKRLDLSRKGKFEDMLQGILDVVALPDPLGHVSLRTKLDDGLILERISCPIGVLLIIFEARPEVIANIASLAIKSGNAAILKGGKESTESFKTISTIISAALESTDVPNDAIQLVTTRDAIDPLLQLDRYIDLVIPRGSNSLVSYIKNTTRIPVLGHADGLCSAYLCADADAELATRVVVDAKTDYPAACNSVETLLVDEEALTSLLPAVAQALLAKGVSLRCDERSREVLTKALDKHQAALVQPSQESDYDTEFLDLIIAVKTVPKLATADEALELAMAHINAHGSHHTDVILTRSTQLAKRFKMGVDSAGVYWNASSRMADGMRYGFGTEVGISTNKIHSRGPVGLEGLTIYKYTLDGQGQTAADYGAGGKSWKHEHLALQNGA